MKECFINYKGNEDPKLLDYPKISEEIMDFYDPKVFGDTSSLMVSFIYLVCSKSLNGSSFRNSVNCGGNLPSCPQQKPKEGLSSRQNDLLFGSSSFQIFLKGFSAQKAKTLEYYSAKHFPATWRNNFEITLNLLLNLTSFYSA